MRLVSQPCIQDIPSGSHSCIAAHQANIPQPQNDLLAAIPPLFLTVEITATFEFSVDISIQPPVTSEIVEGATGCSGHVTGPKS